MTFGRNVKAQAAIEFLMTYGWAILAVLVVIGALAYFGVLSPATLLPEKCTFPASLSCTDHSIASGYVAVSLQNGAGRDMRLWGATASGEALSGSFGTVCTSRVNGGIPVLGTDCPTSSGIGDNGCTGGSAFSNGQTKTITMVYGGCAFADTGRDKNRYNVTAFYSWADSPNIMHTLSGELLARRP